MLAPNKMIPFDDKRIPYPDVYGSIKLDGNRNFVRYDGEALTRNMIVQPNTFLPGYLNDLLYLAETEELCFDMELLLPKAGHHGEITKILNAHKRRIPEAMTVHIFDCLTKKEWLTAKSKRGLIAPFEERIERMKDKLGRLVRESDRYFIHDQERLKGPKAAARMFAKALEEGFEGIMLRAANSGYKNWGRCGHKGAWLLKAKAEETFDARVVAVEQQWKMKEGIKRTRNAFGNLETPTRNEENYDLTDSVGAFLVKDEKGRESRIMFAEGVADMKQRRLWWKQRKSLIGKMLEYKSYPGGLDGIRSGRMIRWRPDKD